MAAKPTDKPEQRAAGAVVFFDAGQSPTVRARRQGRWMQHQTLGSLVRRFCFVGLLRASKEVVAHQVSENAAVVNAFGRAKKRP
jgi:hypothetical protein